MDNVPLRSIEIGFLPYYPNYQRFNRKGTPDRLCLRNDTGHNESTGSDWQHRDIPEAERQEGASEMSYLASATMRIGYDVRGVAAQVWRDERGQDMVEYALAATIVAISTMFTAPFIFEQIEIIMGSAKLLLKDVGNL